MSDDLMDLWGNSRDFISAYREKNFEKIWDLLHPEDKKAAETFSRKSGSLEDYVFEQLDFRFKELPENTAISSRIRKNLHGVEYILIFDDENSGIYTKPTQLAGTPLPIKKSDNVYKIKLFDNDIENEIR